MSVVLSKDKTNKETSPKRDIFKFLKDGDSRFYYFLFLLVVGFAFFIVAILTNNGAIAFTGDYTSQGYAFYLNLYDDWWHFLKTGSFRYFDMNTYLGANHIGSNTFYSLTDPFFFIVLVFPRHLMPQAMTLSMIIRMSLAGLAFLYYLRYMGVSEKSGRLAGVAYAYCGWTAWFLWFSNFSENAITFVLILYGVEKVLKEKKPWLLMASLFLAGITNYFFLVAFSIMGFIYAMWRWAQRYKLNDNQTNFKILGIGFIAFLAGILMAMVVFLPSFIVALEAPRVTESTYLDSLKEFIKNKDWKQLFDYMFSWKHVDSQLPYRKYFSIIEFFYPVMSDRGTPLTVYGNESYDNTAGSVYCYMLFIILLVPALIRSIKQKNYWPVVGTILMTVMLVTPFCYYLFFGFTKPYSRWTIFATTSLLTYTAQYLDHLEEEPRYSVLIGGAFALIGAIVSGYLANIIITKGNGYTARHDLFLAILLESLYIIILVGLIYAFLNKKQLKDILNGSLVFEAVIMGTLTIYGHGITAYDNINYSLAKNEILTSLVKKVSKDDNSYYRTYTSLSGDSNKNEGMRNGYNASSFFHSLYNFDVTNFSYWSSLITNRGSWSGRYIEKKLDLDKYLGIKYYYIEKDRVQVIDHYSGSDKKIYLDKYQLNTPHDFIDITNEYMNDTFYIYKDNNYIDFALTYDQIYSYEDEENDQILLDSSSTSWAWTTLRNTDLFMRGGAFSYKDTKEIIETYSDIHEEDIYQPFSNESGFKWFGYSNNGSSSSVKYTWYQLNSSHINKESSLEELVDVTNTGTVIAKPESGKINNKTVLVVTPKSSSQTFPYDEEGMTYYMNATYASSTKIDVYIIGEDNKLITYDYHNDDRSTMGSSHAGPRGFYIKKDPVTGKAPKVKEIIIVPRWNTLNNYDLVYEGYSSFMNNKYNELSSYRVSDVHYEDDHFDFKTNFEKNRFVSTRVAYDKGWKITAKDLKGKKTEIKTYLSQGGFVGFVSLKGEVTYSMDYQTPLLKEGSLLSALGFTMFFATLLPYLYMEIVPNKKRLMMSLNRYSEY